jgi:hypothetical protein
LPLKSSRTAYFVAAALAIAFVAIGISIFFTGISATTLVSHNEVAAPATPAQIPAPNTNAPATDMTATMSSNIPRPGSTLTAKRASESRAAPRTLQASRSDSVAAH